MGNNKRRPQKRQHRQKQAEYAETNRDEDAPVVDKKMLKEIEQLEKRIQEMAPQRMINPFSQNSMKHKKKASSSVITKFEQLPLSKRTKIALKKANYETLTEIQQMSLLHSLSGRDVLGAAKTGSGKTLAFIIPVLENLYRRRWTRHDGLGALILSPSRELSTQIFEVLRLVGKYHGLSAGLVVGGMKNFEEEARFISGMNILVGTTGRLLKHMDETAGFDCRTLQILVLDEADRLLELGFEKELNAIIDNLPSQRQTLLFSATQTKSIKDLARLSLNKSNTEYVSVHEEEVMPEKLNQSYIQCELQDKLDILFSFVRKHLKSKTVVFCSTMKQVSFLSKVFHQLAVGIKICKLSGGMSQNVRREQYELFCASKAAVLFATDVASRGLDFPRVDLVFHLDIPISPAVYIHRAGRTARNNTHGKSIMLLLPQEVSFLEQLKKVKVDTIDELKVNPKHLVSIKDQLSALVSHEVKLKYLAMRYFESYLKHLSKNVGSVKVNALELPLDAFAQRLGLMEKPNVQLQSKDMIGKEADQAQKSDQLLQKLSAALNKQNSDDMSDSDDEIDDAELEYLLKDGEDGEEDSDEENAAVGSLSDSDDESGSDSDDDDDDDSSDSDLDIDQQLESLEKDVEAETKKKRKSKIDKFVSRSNSTVLNKNYTDLIGLGEQDTAEEDFFTVKRENHKLTAEEEDELKYSMRANKRKLLKNEEFAKHVIFKKDKDNNTVQVLSKFEAVVKDLQQQHSKDLVQQKQDYAKQITDRLKKAEKEDKQLQKKRLKDKKDKIKEEEKEVEKMRQMLDEIEYGTSRSAKEPAQLASLEDGEEIADGVEVESSNAYQKMLKEYGEDDVSSSESSDEEAEEEEDLEDKTIEKFTKQLKQKQSNTKLNQELMKKEQEKMKQMKIKEDEKKRKFEELMKEAPKNPKPSKRPKKDNTKTKSSNLSEEELALQLLDQIY